MGKFIDIKSNLYFFFDLLIIKILIIKILIIKILIIKILIIKILIIKMKDVTKNIPKYCINLESRPDRRKSSMENFEKLGIKNVKYPHFTKDKRGGVYGCYDSHMKIWKMFYETKQPYCLIFEDDFTFKRDVYEMIKIIKKTIKFVDNNLKDVDTLLLHNFCLETKNNLNNDDFINGYGGGTHAMIVTRPYIKNILKKYGKFPVPDGIDFDFAINFDSNNILYTKKIFYTKNECFGQLNSKSDNANSNIHSFIKENISNDILINMLLINIKPLKIFFNDDIAKFMFINFFNTK
jgi:GR25 family glycosyltransferase involved in LPS biosynthesis